MPPQCQQTQLPAAVRDACLNSESKVSPPRLTAHLENKSHASQVHFRVFYRSHHPAQPCRAAYAGEGITTLGPSRPSWTWSSVLSRAALLEQGSAQDRRSSPGRARQSTGPEEQPWKSKAEQATHRTGGAALEEQGRAQDWRSSQAGAGTVPVRQPPARTQPLLEQQTKLQRACAQQSSAHAIAAQVAAAGKTTKPPPTTTKRQTTIAISNDRVMHFDGSACGGTGGRCSRSPREVKFTPAPSRLIPTGEVQVHGEGKTGARCASPSGKLGTSVSPLQVLGCFQED
ncbi:uncharacterized protein LOC128852011 [Cuculus canorus]|uniref:uncharacterized protein LOC128852011 n=1 Tax=Cuculus canorus TaxID=55661 RepID=UPI0023AB0A28|nr:uncharacterized protein LOC128852011 [Cuculus canorus]